MAWMSAFFAPAYFFVSGPLRILDAATRSSLMAERQRAKTASAIVGRGHAHVERVDAGPFAGALLAGSVENHVDQGLLLCHRILLLQDVGGDLDQVGVQRALVPFGEHRADLRGLQAEQAAHEIVGLADHLHVAVLDPVVDHLHIVAGAVGADVGGARHSADDGPAGLAARERTAGRRIDLGRDGIPDRLQFLVGGRIAARASAKGRSGRPFRRRTRRSR